RIDLEHAHVETHRLVDHVGGTGDRVACWRELRERNETLDVVADVDDDAFVHQANDRARELRAHGICLTDTEPWIFFGLLEPEADALVLRIYIQDYDIDRVTLLHDLRRVLHAFGPAHVGDVNEPVDPRLDLDESVEYMSCSTLPATH